MSIELILKTIIPLFSLMLLGYLSRFMDFLRSGDERVLSSYLYYFGLPGLLIIDISEMSFTYKTLQYMGINVAPLLISVITIAIIGKLLALNQKLHFLYIIVAAFGNLGFFGLAFVQFAFDTFEAERYAALSVASINTVGFILALVLLETASNSNSNEKLGRKILTQLSRNPLILSILLGVLLSILDISIPGPLSSALHMLASSVAPIAIFMLGVSLFGKKFTGLTAATLISSIRLIILPGLALLVSKYFGLSTLGTSVIVIMYGSPLALSMVILSERYGFMEKEITSIILVSSLLSGITMNIWIYLVEVLL